MRQRAEADPFSVQRPHTLFQAVEEARHRFALEGLFLIGDDSPGNDASPLEESLHLIGVEGCSVAIVVGIETELSVGELARWLRQLEAENGRQRNCEKFSSRTLDIDILSYDDFVGRYDGVLLPRPEILENAFVLWPLAEVAGDTSHPIKGLLYNDLWAAFDKSKQQLWKVDLDWAPPAK